MFKRIAIFLLASLFVASGTSTLFSLNVSAAGYKDMNIDNQITSIVYYYAMDECFSGVNKISNAAISGGNYDNNDSVQVGHFIDGNKDGKISCSQLASNAKTMWYGGSMEAMIKDFGYQLKGNDWTMDGGTMSKISSSIRSKVFNGQNPPSLDGAQKFLLYNEALRGGSCDLRNPTAVISTLTESQRANYKNQPNKYLLVKVLEDKKVVEKYYEYTQKSSGGNSNDDGLKSSTKTPVSSDGTPNILSSASCKELASGVNSNISYYLKNVNSGDEQKITDKDSGDTQGSSSDDTVSCNIDGIGWIVCPAMTFIAKMNDAAFDFISGNFLQVDATKLRDNAELKEAWGTFRTFANAAFVIVFMLIIYGQMTGRGN